jgi:hypothetical protein
MDCGDPSPLFLSALAVTLFECGDPSLLFMVSLSLKRSRIKAESKSGDASHRLEDKG